MTKEEDILKEIEENHNKQNRISKHLNSFFCPECIKEAISITAEKKDAEELEFLTEILKAGNMVAGVMLCERIVKVKNLLAENQEENEREMGK